MLSGKRGTDDPSHTHTDETKELPAESLTPDRALFRKWLAERQSHFDEIGASPADVAYFALQDGFPETIVRQWEQHERWERIGETL